MNTVRSTMIPTSEQLASSEAFSRESYERVVARAMALPEDKKLHIATDIPAALLRSRTALPGLVAFRSAMLTLPGFEIAALDQFDDTSRAMLAVDVQRPLDDGDKKTALDRLTTECERIRSIAIADTIPLVARGAVSAADVEQIKEGQGRDDLSRDLLSLASTFETVLDQGAVPTAVTREEIAYMRGKAGALRDALESVDLNKKRREYADLRARIYTLFVNDWSQIRRAMTYLRWNEGDADILAPSLFLKGKRSSSSSSEENTEEDNGTGDEASERNMPVAPPQPAPVDKPTRGVPQNDPFVR